MPRRRTFLSQIASSAALALVALLGSVSLAAPTPFRGGSPSGKSTSSSMLPALPVSGGSADLVASTRSWRYIEGNQGARSELLSPPETIPGTGGSAKGYRFRTLQTGKFPYGVLLKRVVPVALPKGQGYRLRFRAASPDGAQVSAIVELAAKPYTKSLDKQFKLSKNWQEYSLPFRSIGYDAQGSTITFFLGHSIGEIKLGDVRLEPDSSAASLTIPSAKTFNAASQPHANPYASRLIGLASSSGGILPEDSIWRYTNGKTRAEKITPPAGNPAAFRMHVTQVGQQPWNVLMKCNIPSALPRGESYRLRFQARSPSRSPVTAIVELAGKPYSKSLTKPIVLGESWQTYTLPFRSIGYGKAGSTVTFFLGHRKGDIDLSNVQVVRGS